MWLIFFLGIASATQICNTPSTDLCLGFSTDVKLFAPIQVKSRLGAFLKNTTLPEWKLDNGGNVSLTNKGIGKSSIQRAILMNQTLAVYKNQTVQLNGLCLTIMKCEAMGKTFCNPYSKIVSPPGTQKKGSYLQWRTCTFTDAQRFTLDPLCAPGCTKQKQIAHSCSKECRSKYCMIPANYTCTNVTSSPTFMPTMMPSQTPTREQMPSTAPTLSPFLSTAAPSLMETSQSPSFLTGAPTKFLGTNSPSASSVITNAPTAVTVFPSTSPTAAATIIVTSSPSDPSSPSPTVPVTKEVSTTKAPTTTASPFPVWQKIEEEAQWAVIGITLVLVFILWVFVIAYIIQTAKREKEKTPVPPPGHPITEPSSTHELII